MLAWRSRTSGRLPQLAMVALAQPPAVRDFLLGDIIDGRYQIVRKLAEGGMGTVYLAEHVLIRRRVALKLLHSELAEDSAMIRRFMNCLLYTSDAADERSSVD